MAITPVDSPLQYQYKPLNLMAFAEPLAKMQEKYDLTKAAIDESDVKATALQWAEDPEKAKKLEELYRSKRDELAQNLAETKNYTQAASKIKQLQKLWTEDPERLALEGNYKLWQERNKEELARVEKGDIPKEQYLQWVADEKRNFISGKGTNYRIDEATGLGTYNPTTSDVGRIKDKAKEFDDLKLELAKAVPSNKWQGVLAANGIDPTTGDAMFSQSSGEKLSASEIESRVETYLKSLDRFKPWLNEVADYNFKDVKYGDKDGAKFKETADRLIGNAYNSNEAYIKNLEKNKKKDTQEYTEALANRTFLTEQKENPSENVVKHLFTQEHKNRQYDAAAAGELLAFNNSKVDYTFRNIPKEGSGDGSGGLDILGNAPGLTPVTEIPTVSSLTAQAGKHGQAAYSSLATINNIAGGAFRGLTMGHPNTPFREKIQGQPGLMRERQEQIFNIVQTATSPEDFRKKLWKAGIKEGANKANTTAVFNALHGEGGNDVAGMISNKFKESQETFNAYNDANDQLKKINRNVETSKPYIKELQTLEETRLETSEQTVIKLAKTWGKTFDQMIESGIVTAYEGAPDENDERTVVYKMKGKFIAQAYGKKSLKEGLNSGFNFSQELDLSRGLDKARQIALNDLGNSQDMTHRVVNSPDIDKALTGLFLTSADLSTFLPVGKSSWNNQIGFDGDGKLLPDVEYDLSNGKKVKLTFTERGMVYEVPLKSKDNKSFSVLVTPKKGSNPTNEKLLIEGFLKPNIKAINNDPNNAYAKQNYESGLVQLYDLKANSNLTRNRAEAMDVAVGAPPLVLETISSGSNGVNFQIVKVNDKNLGEQFKIRYSDGTYEKTPDGKVFTSSDVNAAKAYIAKELYLY